MSVSSQDMLKDTVHHLLSQSQRVNKIWDEISTIDHGSFGHLTRNLTEFGCLPLLNQVAEIQGQTVIAISIQQCVDKLHHFDSLCQDHILSEYEKEELDTSLKMVKQIMMSGKVTGYQLCVQLCKHGSPSVQLVCILHREAVISMENFLQIQGKSRDFISSFVIQIREFATKEQSEPCLTVLLSEVIFLWSQEKKTMKNNVDIKQLTGDVLSSLILGFVDHFLDDAVDTVDHNIIQAYAHVDTNIDSRKKISSYLLTKILCHRPSAKVSFAIKEQSEWTYGKICPDLTQFYKQLLLPLDVAEVLTVLHEILDQHEVNWRLLLSLVSVVIVCMPEATKLFLEFSDKLLQEGLEECEFETALVGMLLARQACFQGAHVFMTYPDWFQRTFSDSTRSLASSRKSFVFFMKFLTDLMPHESAQHIKVHITRPPFAPAKCRQLLTDYTTLAKTRLEDLKETVDLQSEASTSSVNAVEKAQAALDCEIDNTVSVFETTGKVPTSVLEASIFRKPYYIGQFLPALLKPRHLPDKPDSKMKLITALLKADKIPATLYTNYEKACKKVASQLLAGMFVDLDSDDEMELPPLEQFEHSLESLHSTVLTLSGEQNKPKHTVTEAISYMCEKLEGCVGCRPSLQQGPGHNPSSVDISLSYIPNQQLEVVDMLLQCVCRCVQAVYQTECPNFTWLHQLLEALLQYSSVTEALMRRIWTLITQQALSLEPYHLESLAAVLAELQLLGGKLPGIRVGHTECHQCDSVEVSLVDLILTTLPISSKEWMYTVLRLSSCYLKYIYTSHDSDIDSVVSSEVVKKFSYLSTRLLPRLRYNCCLSHEARSVAEKGCIVTALYRSDPVQELISTVQVSLSDWLQYELSVCSEQDALTDSERFEYHNWVIYQHYLQGSQQDGGYEGNSKDMAAVILGKLITAHNEEKTVSSACPECQHQRAQTVSMSSKIYVINILQGLTRLFPPEEGADDLPWLPSQLINRLEKAEGPVQQQRLVEDFFRICFSLPPHLLFSDTFSSVREGAKCILRVVEFINTVMVNHLSEGLYFPAGLSAYLAQTLIQAVDPIDRAAVIDNVLTKCSVITLSFMVNYSTVSPLLEAFMSNKVSLVHQLCEFHRTRSSPSSLDLWHVAVVMFSHILKGNSSDGEPLENSYHIKDKSMWTKIHQYLVEMLVNQLTYVEFLSQYKNEEQRDRLARGLVHILSNSHSQLISFFLTGEQDGFSCLCVKQSLKDARFLSIFRFIADHSNDIDLHVKLDLHGLSGLLQGYSHLNKVMSTELEDIHPKSISPPEILAVTRTLIELLDTTPKQLLMQVDQDLILTCGPAVTECLIRRITQ